MKTCKVCNQDKPLSDYRLVKNKYYRNTCKKCEYAEDQRLMALTVEYISSLKTKCEICGYNRCKKALEFHHINPEEKEFGISHMSTKKFSEHYKKKIDEEAKKCIVVCGNCHMEIHEGLIKL